MTANDDGGWFIEKLLWMLIKIDHVQTVNTVNLFGAFYETTYFK